MVPAGAMIFQPSNERRRSGSHYTPSTLTAPIVDAALRPVLQQIGDDPTPEQILSLKVCDPAMGSGAFLVEACRQLGEALVKAWHTHNQAPVLPPDEDELLLAMRQIAQRCLYGLDKNPMAADLAKLSLWLATLAKDHPFTFLDHSLRAGDSLAGLTRRQIAAFHWLPAEQQTFLEQEIRRRIDRVSDARRRILSAADDTPYATLQQKLDVAEQELYWLRLAGDAVLAAFFSADKPKLREEARTQLRQQMEAALKDLGKLELAEPIEKAVALLRRGPKGVLPFHWELEFPEVFALDAKGSVTGGFDVIVGNPPFAGKNTLIAAHAGAYPDWLKALHEQSHGNSDLVAHFFRRAFTLLRPSGRFGLIATNTIGQGDTRSSGLRWVCTHGGTIYRARKQLRWPGQAAVMVSVVHVAKGDVPGSYLLDDRKVSRITAYLFHDGGHQDPVHLRANESASFIGMYICGMGFTFDDTDTKGVATPLAEMERLIARSPNNRERIFPFLGAEELNDSPTQSHHRYVINFEDWPLRREDVGVLWRECVEDERGDFIRTGIVPLDYPESVAADYPDLLAIVETKVKAERILDNRENYRRYWWQFAERRPGLMRATRGRSRVLVAPLMSKHLSFVFIDARTVASKQLAVIPRADYRTFACLQSRVHEVWARFFSATLEDRLHYAPSDCLETFPFPLGNLADICSSDLDTIGEAYYSFRSDLMKVKARGLTGIYNWFHDPDCDLPAIIRLRELHQRMDRSVLEAYGWSDIEPRWEFIPESDEEEDDDNAGPSRRKRHRYRWPDDLRDDVLARLLDLNRQRVLEEGNLSPEPPLLAGAADVDSPKTNGRRRRSKKEGTDLNLSLLPEEEKA